MAFDFKNIKRCGARCRTKGGAPCLGPAMKNGRCRMHGGVFSRLEKHGRATLRAKAERKQERAFLKEMKKLNVDLGALEDSCYEEVDKSNHLTDEEIYQFFEALLNKCKQYDVYSVIETAEQMHILYNKVKEWASLNEDWKDTLEFCRCHCASHALHDWSSSKLSNELGLKYCLENDDQFAANQQE